jgi:hypothetical protein
MASKKYKRKNSFYIFDVNFSFTESATERGINNDRRNKNSHEKSVICSVLIVSRNSVLHPWRVASPRVPCVAGRAGGALARRWRGAGGSLAWRWRGAGVALTWR